MSLYTTMPDTTNPILTTNKFIKSYAFICFDPLVLLDQTGMLSPGIAVQWTCTEEKKWTFIIREDIQWHDGTKLTAEDVAFTLNTIIQEIGSPYAEHVKNIVEAVATGPYTVSILLNVSDAFFPEKMYLPIVPKHYYENAAKNETKKRFPIGSGPYKAVSQPSNEEILFVQNDKWVNMNINSDKKNAPYVEEIRLKIFDASKTMIDAFNDGDIDVFFTDTFSWDQYAGRNDIFMGKYNSGKYNYLAYNIKGGVLANKEMRQAVSYLLDFKTIFKDMIEEASYTFSPIPPDTIYSKVLSSGYYYDVEKGKDLLYKNGWGYSGNKIVRIDGSGSKQLQITIVINNDNELRKSMAEKIKAWLEALGISVYLQTYSWEGYLERVGANNGWDIALMGMDMGDTYSIPSPSVLYAPSSPFNKVNYDNQEVNTLLDTLQTVYTQEEKAEVLKGIAAITMDEIPYLGMFYENNYVFTNKKIAAGIKPFRQNEMNYIAEWYMP